MLDEIEDKKIATTVWLDTYEDECFHQEGEQEHNKDMGSEKEESGKFIIIVLFWISNIVFIVTRVYDVSTILVYTFMLCRLYYLYCTDYITIMFSRSSLCSAL